jgi:hypothetical protein
VYLSAWRNCGNSFVTSTGKLKKEAYKHFLDSVMRIDSCGGQINKPALYDEKFLPKMVKVPVENNTAEMYTTMLAL